MNEFAFRITFLVGALAVISSQSHVTDYEILEDFDDGKGFETRHKIKRRSETDDETNTISNVSVVTDYHKYYTSKFYESGMQWWYNLSDGPGRPMIHKKSLYSDTVNTTFEFPYYGHIIKSVTITNRGFLFVGDRIHKFNASVQYIAPLMADFGAELNENTKIRYIDTGTRFTAEWTNIKLRNQSEAGQFSFQCSIHKDGRIVFAYKAIPFPVKKIKNDTFFVRVGFSDSFDIHHVKHGIFVDPTGKIYTKVHYVVYYRYHQVELDKSNIKNGSAFLMTPLPNCVLFKSCSDCSQSNLTIFKCEWCPQINRCSDGIDRHRQEWLVYGCYRNTGTTCSLSSSSAPTTMTTGARTTEIHSVPDKQERKRGTGRSGRIAGIVIVVIICVTILMGIIMWCVYAYRRPESRSGTWLLKYGNPKKWFRSSNQEGETIGKQISFKTMPEESEINA